MILPIVLKIKENEILYSYLLRLSQANGFDDPRDFLGTSKILPLYENPKSTYRTVRYDIHSDLYPLLQAAALPTTGVAELYRQTSLFPIWSLTCGRALASHRIGMLSRDRGRTSLITPLADVFQELKFCPQCREQDLNEMGEWYYRRSHQIPGVAVCHRHGCALHLYQGKRGSELDPDQPSIEMNIQEKSLEYAVLAHELLIADLSCDVESIAKAILSRMKERGYSKQTADRLQQEMGAYADLLKTSLKSFFRYFPPKSQCDMQTCITVLLYLFEDVKTLLVYLSPNSLPDNQKQMDEK
ncbi:MAG: TniQ family protein [Clostridia bacterium]|nr:TniQ family protein [Clostridia bacterium]